MLPILGLVGPSGSGKTMLILEMVERFPDQLAITKTYTTRPRRGPEDDLFYDFISPEIMTEKKAQSEFVHVAEYAGNQYATHRQDLNKILENKMAIGALVEDGVKLLRNAGYEVLVIRIQPTHQPDDRDEVRKQADKERAQTPLANAVEIVNAFENGGKEKAIEDLAKWIQEEWRRRS